MDNNSVKYETNNIRDSYNTSSNNNNNSVLDNNQITPNNKTSNKIDTPSNNINSTPKNNNNSSNYSPNNINKDLNVTPNNNNNNITANYINSPNNNTPNNNNDDDNQMSIYYTQLQNLLPQPQINNPQSRLQLLQNVIDYIADLEEMTSSSECTSDPKSYSESSATTPSLSGKLYPVSFTTATSSSSSSGYNKMASIVRNLNESFVVDSLVTFKMK
ncbi:hypothetical protein HELRODRAFT_164715 [Helobdella robusta]|uniref:BHLH domain-containing protein n=1 Tax=Helobdella robusta TaxID=6412 RepID=T1EVR3_HELRO|nr:hypothetical protein HELRODRAFT_164715 [Helobdella robusta]ESN92638.1 hypothetical protein HELRODRAFT_164715 [Helobdella robusta]